MLTFYYSSQSLKLFACTALQNYDCTATAFNNTIMYRLIFNISCTTFPGLLFPALLCNINARKFALLLFAVKCASYNVKIYESL